MKRRFKPKIKKKTPQEHEEWRIEENKKRKAKGLPEIPCQLREDPETTEHLSNKEERKRIFKK